MIDTLEGLAPTTAIYPDGKPKPGRPEPDAIPADWKKKHGTKLADWMEVTFLPAGVTEPNPENPQHWQTVRDVKTDKDVIVTPGTETTENVRVFGFAIIEPATGLELFRQEPQLHPDTPETTNKERTLAVARRMRDALDLGRPKSEVIAELDAKVTDMVDGHGKRLESLGALRAILEKRSGA